MKNLLSLGTVLSKEQAQHVNGGISVSCSSSNGTKNCTIVCSNGNSFRIIVAGNTQVSARSVNGKETVTYGGKTFNC